MTQARIALLRGVNVGGRKLLMAELKAAAEAEGFVKVRTLLQSGNLVFEADGRGDDQLEAALEDMSRRRLGLNTDFHVRSAGEWAAMIAANPYPEAARDDPAHLLLALYKAMPRPAAWEELRAWVDETGGAERFSPGARCGYFVFPDGIGNSKLALTLDRRLGVMGTARNWNTVLKLAALAGA